MNWVHVSAGKADPTACVISDQVRFTVLTSTLVRLEYSAERQFEDRPSLFGYHRRLPVPDYTCCRQDGWLTIETAAGFSAETLP